MNSYFQCKQFTIHQDRCAQKVSEIACLFGAWIALHTDTVDVLDIGAGTGLLSLMLAQRYEKIHVDAVEIHEDTFKQLCENCEHSPFASRLHPIHADIRKFTPQKKYDAIVVNPPFHENQLKSQIDTKNQAWHSDTLTLKDLLQCADEFLSTSGELFIVLPIYRLKELSMLASERHLFLQDITRVKHSESSSEKIMLTKLARIQMEPLETTLVVKENGEYTTKARCLLTPFYLKL